MKAIIYTLTVDDDCGTRTEVFGNAEAADRAHRELVEAYWCDYGKGEMPDDLDEAWDIICDRGCIDAIIYELHTVDVEPVGEVA